jgi:hypothetical protein
VPPDVTEPPPALPEHDMELGGLTAPHCGRPGSGWLPWEHIVNAACSPLHPAGTGPLELQLNGACERQERKFENIGVHWEALSHVSMQSFSHCARSYPPHVDAHRPQTMEQPIFGSLTGGPGGDPPIPPVVVVPVVVAIPPEPPVVVVKLPVLALDPVLPVVVVSPVVTPVPDVAPVPAPTPVVVPLATSDMKPVPDAPPSPCILSSRTLPPQAIAPRNPRSTAEARKRIIRQA